MLVKQLYFMISLISSGYYVDSLFILPLFFISLLAFLWILFVLDCGVLHSNLFLRQKTLENFSRDSYTSLWDVLYCKTFAITLLDICILHKNHIYAVVWIRHWCFTNLEFVSHRAELWFRYSKSAWLLITLSFLLCLVAYGFGVLHWLNFHWFEIALKAHTICVIIDFPLFLYSTWVSNHESNDSLKMWYNTKFL